MNYSKHNFGNTSQKQIVEEKTTCTKEYILYNPIYIRFNNDRNSPW